MERSGWPACSADLVVAVNLLYPDCVRSTDYEVVHTYIIGVLAGGQGIHATPTFEGCPSTALCRYSSNDALIHRLVPRLSDDIQAGFSRALLRAIRFVTDRVLTSTHPYPWGEACALSKHPGQTKQQKQQTNHQIIGSPKRSAEKCLRKEKSLTIDGTRCAAAAAAMATRDSPGSSVRSSPPSSSDVESDTDSPSPQDSAVCRWRTAQYHDQECSRYFDCPSHTVYRLLSDDEQGEPDEEPREAGGTGPGGFEDRPDPGAVSPLSDDDEGDGGNGRSARSPSPDSLGRHDRSGADIRMRGDGEEPDEDQGQQGRSGDSAENPIVLVDSSPVLPSRRAESERRVTSGSRSGSGGGSRIPTLPSPGSMVRSSEATAALQAAPAAPSPTTPAPGPSAILSTGTEHRAPPEFVLPRWQPDAEVTYCPICHTQFSIFIRKHHCR